MSDHSFTHLSNHALLSTTKQAVVQERAHTARLIALLAEIDTRRLFAPAGYPSMHEFCVRELGLSEDAAGRRIRAARAARDFPVLLEALSDGRLHLSGVVALAPHVSRDTVDELLKEASNQTRSAIELMLARRFPQADVPTRVRALPAAAPPQDSQSGMLQEFTNAYAPARMNAPDSPTLEPTTAAPPRVSQPHRSSRHRRRAREWRRSRSSASRSN